MSWLLVSFDENEYSSPTPISWQPFDFLIVSSTKNTKLWSLVLARPLEEGGALGLHISQNGLGWNAATPFEKFG